MKQALLSLTSANPATYTQLSTVRASRYATRGPDLVRDVMDALTALEETEDGFEALADLNDLTLELGALNSVWFDFSVAVFTALMSYSPTSPRTLRTSFNETTERIQSSVTGG